MQAWWRQLTQISWEHPWLLLLVVLAAPVWWWTQRTAASAVFSSFARLPRQHRSWRLRLAWVPAALLSLACLAWVVALAGPRIGKRNSLVRADGIAIMMVVDTSSSMLALDLSDKTGEKTRLDAIKDVFKRFVNGGGDLGGRANDTIGLVSFAAYADTKSPLTLDHGNLLAALDATEIVEPGSEEDGTAIGDGLALGLQRLQQSAAASKVVLLLTDGENNAGEQDPRGVGQLAAKLGIKVYTIGAGTNGSAPVRLGQGARSRLVSMPVRIDEGLLKAVAEQTGGRYFRATDAEGLRHIYETIDQLEKTKFQQERFLEYRYFNDPLVLLGMVCIAVALALRFSVLRRFPE